MLGKTLTLDQRTELVVGAIIEDQPRQSHLSFDFLLALPDRWKDCWRLECGHSYTYVKLRPGADVAKVEAAIQRLVETHQSEPSNDRYYTQPLAGMDGIHLASHRLHELQANSNKLYIHVLMGGAFFILLIAGINYVNLATARSMLRAREIGVRKVVGAQRQTLIRQFLVESVLMSVTAGIAALGLTQLVPDWACLGS